MNKLFWILVLGICLGFVIWILGFGLVGGCASTVQDVTSTLPGSTTTTTSAATTTHISTTTTIAPATSTTTTSLTTYTTLPYGTDWVPVGGMVGTKTGFFNFDSDMKISKGGTIYVAYADQLDSGKIKVKKYSEGDWVEVGGAVSNEQGYFSLSIAGDGTPYIGYVGGYPYGSCTMKKYNGVSWITVATADVSADGMIFLLVSDDGTTYLAYSDKSDGYKAKVLRYSGSSWINLGGNASAGGGVGALRFYIDGNDLYLGYQDSTLHDYYGTVRKYVSATWETVGDAGFTDPAIPDNIQLFVSSGVPYFVPASLGLVMSYESGTNSWTTIATNERGSFFVDNGIPYMAEVDYFNDQSLILKKYASGVWTQVPPGGIITGRIAYCVMSVYNGVPYIAYTRSVSDNPPIFAIYVTKYIGP